MPLLAENVVTRDEYARLSTHRRTELVRGEVVDLTRPKPRHGRVVNNIATDMTDFVRPRGLGQVYGSEIGYVVEDDPDTIRSPDVSFVRAEVADAHDEDEWYAYAPDLAVEVVSPSNTATHVADKVRMWFAAGGRSVWVVDPDRRAGAIHRADGSVVRVGESDHLRDDAVLPGYAVRLRDVLDRR